MPTTGRYNNKLAALKIGTAAVLKIKDIKFNRPQQQEYLADELAQDDAEVLDIQARGVYSLDVTVNIDDSDTTGQVALMSAYDGRTTIASVVYAPKGFVTGNPTFTGSVYVTSAPSPGGVGRAIATGTYRLVFTAKPTAGTAT